MAAKTAAGKNSSFDVVKVVLVLIILALAGYIGYSAWNSHHKSQVALNNAKSSATSTTDKKSQKAGSGQIFILKELGVQLSLPSSLSGLIYAANQSTGTNSSPKVDILSLTTPQLVADTSTCTHKQPAGTAPGSFISLSRSEGQYPTGPAALGAGDLMKQFDNFYIVARYPNPTNCVNAQDSATIADHQKTAQQALKEAFKNAQIFNNSP